EARRARDARVAGVEPALARAVAEGLAAHRAHLFGVQVADPRLRAVLDPPPRRSRAPRELEVGAGDDLLEPAELLPYRSAHEHVGGARGRRRAQLKRRAGGKVVARAEVA